jgi:hypothetical protein
MARGEVDRPVSLKGAKEMAEEAKAAAAPVRKPLSQGSIEALEQVKKATETGQGVDPDAPTVADPMSDGQTTEELDKADGKVVKERDNDFDFDAINETQKMLMSPDRRKLIEGRLSPLDIEDMIVKREIQQTVVVIPGKLSYTFRTFNQSESLFCLRYVYDFPGSMIFANELLNTCKMVCSLVAVNGAMLPDHRKGLGSDKEEVDRELFEKKKHHVAGLPVQLIGDLSVNAIWFNDRVTKLFSLDNLKNG